MAADSSSRSASRSRVRDWDAIFLPDLSPTPTTVAFKGMLPKPDAIVPVPTVASAVLSTITLPWRVGQRLFRLRRAHETPRNPTFSLFVRPGEMVLVASAEPAECTQFLRAIVRHVSCPGIAVFCSAEDVHPHVLTVEQLLRFRLRARAVRSPGAEDDAVELLLRLFRIESIRNTLIGNAVVRGISGGERRRLSVAEALLSGANVLCFDDLTRGLDAATALHCVQCLRSVVDAYRLTIFASLSAASDTIYATFDQLVAIRDGHQVFGGPPTAVRPCGDDAQTQPAPPLASYFDHLHARIAPRASSPTAHDMADAFRRSAHYADTAVCLATYLAEEQASPGSSNQSPRHHQKRHAMNRKVVALLQRQMLLAWKDRFALTVSWILFLVLGCTIGLACFQLQRTGAGAQARGGLLYTCVLGIAVSAQVEVAKTTLGRPLLRKVFAYRFERPATFWTAQIAVDTMLESMRVFIFAICVYFLTALHRTAPAFLYFLAVLLLLYMCKVLMNRAIGCMCRTFDSAIRTATFVFVFYMITAGYIVSQATQPSWLKWTYYLNPLALAFSALMMNEFEHITIDCQSSVLSFPPTRPLPVNALQSGVTCGLATSADRTFLVAGRTYLQLDFDYDTHDKVRTILNLLALMGLFFIANLALAEILDWDSPASSVMVSVPKNIQPPQQTRTACMTAFVPTPPTSEFVQSPAAWTRGVSRLTFCRLRHDIATGRGQQSRRLLDEVTGALESGQLLAVMGASGAGKTTLLNLLSGREHSGVRGGTVSACTSRGLPPTIGYAEQVDIHEPKSTVREAMLFSACLRQPKHVSFAEKRAWVDHLIPLLELTPIQNAIIGVVGSGSELSARDRKRTTIAVELAAKPDILFLDEPTTGLGSEGALAIARLLRKLADHGQAIACSIHQPSASTLENFDQVLFLHNGKMVYFGPLGSGLCRPAEYIARQTCSSCPVGRDPVEWMTTQVIGSSPAHHETWSDAWASSEEADMLQASLKPTSYSETSRAESMRGHPCQASVWYQIHQLTLRNSTALWRTPEYGFSRFINHVALAVTIRIVLPHAGHSIRDMVHRVLALWQTTMLPAFILTTVEYRFHASRRLSLRESATSTYSNTALAVSAMLVEIPYCFLCTAGFVLPLFSLVGPLVLSQVTYFALAVFLVQIFCVTLAQAIATLSPYERISTLFNTPSITVFALFCGISVPRSELPGFLRNWLYYLNPYTWLMSGLLTNSIHGFNVQCAENELTDIMVPLPQTCQQAMSLLSTLHDPGYIAGNTSQVCHYCPLTTGDRYSESLGLSYAQRWKYLGVFSVFCVSNVGLILLAQQFRRR
ncbi:unnamed protein product [Zymoseptoria tritici ST99CH_1E4]|uniref:ABC transporter domain-containing protein n=1 Tax=Zymoseptoria tritici ST99CH_1E4 TaxID=1276532 RepID=A0A2H1GQD2_ZYMTR|nr:unnamed protein product [Zymoseptoria tritici ST99CH_1E4]